MLADKHHPVPIVLHLVQPVGPAGTLTALMGNANVYSILSAKKLPQSIDVFDLTGIAHVPTMPTLRQFVTQVRHCNVRTILLKQAVSPVLPPSAALVAHKAHHLLISRGLTE
jgi:hypothetical protein